MENGSLVTIDNSRKAVYGYDQRVEVFGSEGMISVGNDTTSSAVISTAEGVTGENHYISFWNGICSPMQKKYSVSYRQLNRIRIRHLGIIDGLEAVRMGLAARKSLEEHRPVKISEIITNCQSLVRSRNKRLEFEDQGQWKK